VSLPIVLVTDSHSLSLALTGLDYDLVELRPDELQDWLSEGSEPPALLVVGVDQPSHAHDVVSAATAAHPGTPALVVSSTAPGWDALALPDEHMTVLPLPITRTSLVAAAERLMAASAPLLPVAAEPVPEVVAAPVHETAAPVPEPTPSAAAAPTPVAKPNRSASRHMVGARSTDALRERLAQRADASDGAVAAPAHTAFDPTALRVEMEEPPPPPVTAPRPVSHRQVPKPEMQVRDLVEGVLAALDELYDVRDAATAVVVESLSAAAATSGVVLLPDGDLWRVTGAAGVRPLEWRYVVEPDSWLVATVVSGDRGVIIEDSDIARQRLGGAPLSHYPQLLAAPIPQARGLVLIARQTVAFTEDQLGAVATLASEAGPLLADALRVRDLARALSDYRAYTD